VIGAALGKLPHVSLFGTDYPTDDGTCVRDYVHVADLAEAHILALGALGSLGAESPFRVYNLGADRAASVLEVIRMVEEVGGSPVKVLESPRRPGDPAVLIASSKKIKEELKWEPRFSELKAIVESALAWHRRCPAGYQRDS
jgi:UDP-glucose 4-epimerase